MLDGSPDKLTLKERLERDMLKSFAKASIILEMLDNRIPLDLKTKHILSRMLNLHGIKHAAPLPADPNQTIQLLQEKIAEAERIQKIFFASEKLEVLSDDDRIFLTSFTGNINLVPEEAPEPPINKSFGDLLNKTLDGDRDR